MSDVRCITGEPTPGDREEQEDALALLRCEVKTLRNELQRLMDWPEGMSERDNTKDGWRRRALIAETKLADAYSRLRALNDQMIEKGSERT